MFPAGKYYCVLTVKLKNDILLSYIFGCLCPYLLCSKVYKALRSNALKTERGSARL